MLDLSKACIFCWYTSFYQIESRFICRSKKREADREAYENVFSKIWALGDIQRQLKKLLE
jgi:hypothetical protein